jgi:hypothetical protein
MVFVVAAKCNLRAENQAIREEDLRHRIDPYLQTTN